MSFPRPADIYDLPFGGWLLAHALQACHRVGDETESAQLAAVTIDDRLLAPEHAVDHDGCDVTVRITVALPRADNAVRYCDRVLAAMPGEQVLDHELGRMLGQAIWRYGVGFHVLGERRRQGAVSGHGRAMDEPAGATRDTGGGQVHGSLRGVLEHE